MFELRSIGDISAEDIELYLRRRLQVRVQFKKADGVVQKDRFKPATVHQDLRVLRRMLNVAVRKKLLPANPCAGAELPVKVKGLFRPHYVSWSEQQRIEFTGARVHAEYHPNHHRDRSPGVQGTDADEEGTSRCGERCGLDPGLEAPNGIAEAPLTDLAIAAFREHIRIAGTGCWLFSSDENSTGHQKTLKTAWHATLRRAKVPYFRPYDPRSTYTTRLSAGGVADECSTQLLRQGDAKVFKKNSQMKLQMKREAPRKRTEGE